MFIIYSVRDSVPWVECAYVFGTNCFLLLLSVLICLIQDAVTRVIDTTLCNQQVSVRYGHFNYMQMCEILSRFYSALNARPQFLVWCTAAATTWLILYSLTVSYIVYKQIPLFRLRTLRESRLLVQTWLHRFVHHTDLKLSVRVWVSGRRKFP